MLQSGIELPKVSFSSINPATIEPGSFFIGFDLDNNGYLSKLDQFGNITVLEPISGPQGPQGGIGAQGPIGAQGTQGVTGLTGAVGPQGLAGAQGVTGVQGAQGFQGISGTQGSQGPGAQGFQGSQGSTGPQGAAGDSLSVQGIIANYAALPAMPSFLDTYITQDTSTLYVYDPTSLVADPNGWVNMGQIGGPQGPAGSQGPQGITGTQGPQGSTGAQGTAGSQGAAGPQGPQGDQGTTGAQGAVGPQGTVGAQGSAGPQGPQGLTGSTGFQGPAGLQGDPGVAGTNGAQGPQGFQGAQGAASSLAVFDGNGGILYPSISQLNVSGAGVTLTPGMGTMSLSIPGAAGFVPYTGATANVDLGTFNLSTANIALPNTTTSTSGVITKGSNRFMHNFQHPTGGTAIPIGRNTMLGELAGNFTMGSTATTTSQGSYNTMVGYQAGLSTTTGFLNTLVGYNAGAFATTGYSNTFVGGSAGGNFTTGYFNVFIGERAGTGAGVGATGYENIGIGVLAANSLSTGFRNICIGMSAAQSMTTGFQNTVIHGGGGLTTGFNNVFLGYGAGGTLADGTTLNQSPDNSIFIGPVAKALSAGNTNQIVIGANTTGNGSNTVTIGNSSVLTNHFSGSLKVTGNTTTLPVGAVANYYFNNFTANTLAFSGASTATNVYGLFANAATVGANATITNNYAAGFDGDIRVGVSATGTYWRFGRHSASSFAGALYHLPTATAISTTNYSLRADQTNIELNSVGAAGYVSLQTAANNRLRIYGVVASGAVNNFAFTAASNTGQTASTEISGYLYNSYSRQWATGAITTQREQYIKTVTYSFAGASTITNAYGLYVEAATAGTNATITNNWALGTNGDVKFITGTSTEGLKIQGLIGSLYQPALYAITATPSSSNYAWTSDGVSTINNASTGVYLRVLGANVLQATSTSVIFHSTKISGSTNGLLTFENTSATNTGSTTNFTFNTTANTGQTASTNIPNFRVNGSTKTWATGNITNQYWNYFTANTAAFGGASTITNSYGLYVEAATAGTNATISNNYAAGFGGAIHINSASDSRIYFGATNSYVTGVANMRIAGAEVFIDAAGATATIRTTNTLWQNTDGLNFQFGTSTGSKIATAANQKIGFWNATPIVQPTTAISPAAYVAVGGGSIVRTTDTFDGYTLAQVVKALRDAGLLA